MSLNLSGPLFRRINLIVYVLLEVVLFVVANATAENSHRPGIVSNVFWFAFLIGIGLLLLAGAAALTRRLRGRAH